jgi:hypothetical protein
MHNDIRQFIDSLPPEFASVRLRALQLLKVHKDDVMAAYLAGSKMWTKDGPYTNAEDYYQATHGSRDTGQNHQAHD